MPEELLNKIISDQAFRKHLATKSLYWFTHIYFYKYIGYPTAEFHKELAELLQDWHINFLEVLGFRGSAKSVYAMLALPIWAMITGQAHFIVLISDAISQVKQHLENIKAELEDNELLAQDFGPFANAGILKSKEEWNKTSIAIPKYQTKIIALSSGQKTRGIRKRQHRPDLTIADDIEDLKKIKVQEQRNKLYKWYNGEVLPLGDKEKTKHVLVGNLLHKDSLMNRIKKEIESGSRDGMVREYPLLDSNNNITWIGKFPNQEAIEKERNKINDPVTWAREYLLKIIAEKDQVITEDKIKYYNRLPKEHETEFNWLTSATGIDLAISERETADFTAMVSARVYHRAGKQYVFILPRIVNDHLDFKRTMNTAKNMSLYAGNNRLSLLYVEDVAYQKAAIQTLKDNYLPVYGINPAGSDKRARLTALAPIIETEVYFPRQGADNLIMQLLGFGTEEHDDLADALCNLLFGIRHALLGEAKVIRIT